MFLGQYSAVQRRTCLAVQAVFMAKCLFHSFFRLLTRTSLADVAALCRSGLELLVMTIVMADTCLQLAM